ncbi:phage tail protein [Kribbella sp. NPDC026611]|uniref:phage tail protein n=1 Tax=Kribbella sp. NPDC026611 TaxID=3154911 RepID=UPI0033CA9EAE
MRVPGLQELTNPGQLIGAATRPDVHRPSGPPQLGMTMWFSVSVPRLDFGEPAWLGAWSGCGGLEVDLTPEGPFAEGGNYTTPHYLPGRIGYKPVTLERAMTADGSAKVRRWLEQLSREWTSGRASVSASRSPIVITLFSGIGRQATKIHTWELADPVPVAWAVPPFSTRGSEGFAIERLTIQHSGFLKPTTPPPGHELRLVDAQQRELTFEYNPAKIRISKSREAANGKKRFSTGAEVIDANALSIKLSQLPIEGCTAVERAGGLLRDWLEFVPDPGKWTAARPTLARKPQEKPTCNACGKTMSPPAESPGTPKELRIVWGSSRGGMPETMILRQFDLDLVRFTTDGRPSRAMADLTLQEYTPVRRPGGVRIGDHRGKAG